MSDIISREAALEAIDRERGFLIENKMYGAEHVVVHHARRIIEDLPIIDAIPVAWLKTQINEALDDNETELASDIDWLIRKYINEQEENGT